MTAYGALVMTGTRIGSVRDVVPGFLALLVGAGFLQAAQMIAVGILRNRQYELLTAQLQPDAERERLARKLSESKLRLLRAQIEPHFLFNTLGAVQQPAQHGAPRAADLTADLIAFLRASLGDLLTHLQAALPGMRQERTRWLKASVGRQIRVIDVDDVLFFQSDTKYTRVVLRDYEALVRTPLKDLLSGLDRERFWQIHRGTVVNATAIAAAERIDAERMQVLLRGCDEKLTVSRTFAHLFRD